MISKTKTESDANEKKVRTRLMLVSAISLHFTNIKSIANYGKLFHLK